MFTTSAIGSSCKVEDDVQLHGAGRMTYRNKDMHHVSVINTYTLRNTYIYCMGVYGSELLPADAFAHSHCSNYHLQAYGNNMHTSAAVIRMALHINPVNTYRITCCHMLMVFCSV